MDELKPCPFCGEAPDSGWTKNDTFTISCSNSKCCVFARISASSEREAANFWNTRATDTRQEQPTLRDQFAMAALNAAINNDGIDDVVKAAYYYADAILKVRGES